MFRFTKRLLPLKYSDQHFSWISHHVRYKAKRNVIYVSWQQTPLLTLEMDFSGLDALSGMKREIWHVAEKVFFFFLFEHELSRGIIRLYGWSCSYRQYASDDDPIIIMLINETNINLAPVTRSSSRKQHSYLLLREIFSDLYPVSIKVNFSRRFSYNHLQETGFPVNICTSEWSMQFTSIWSAPNFIIGLLVNCTVFLPSLPQTWQN
jgi:hypothetical protein